MTGFFSRIRTAVTPARAAMLGVFLTAIAAYIPSVAAPFIYDDIVFVEGNTRLKEPLLDQMPHLLSSRRMLTYLTFAVNYRIGGPDTPGYHAVNMLIHASVTVLVFVMAGTLYRLSFRKDSAVFPLFAALLFAVHPLATEAVAYIYNRSSSLVALFYLLSLVTFAGAFERGRGWIGLAPALVSFALALLAKESAATLPAVLLVFDFVFVSDMDARRVLKNARMHLPFWAILGIYLLLYRFHFTQDAWPEVVAQWQGLSYYMVQPWVLVRFISMTLVPVGLCIDHVFKPMPVTDPRVILSAAGLIAVGLSALRLYRLRTPSARLALFGILWFFITLAPTNLLIVHMGERHLYLPLAGLMIAFAAGYRLLLHRLRAYHRGRTAAFLIFAVHASLLWAATVQRNFLYAAPDLMWESAISLYPDNARAYSNLGIVYSCMEERTLAARAFSRAIELAPGYSFAHNNLGVIHSENGRHDLALAAFREALRLRPGYADALANLGLEYSIVGEFDKAEESLRAALASDPRSHLAYCYLARLYARKGDAAAAERYYRTALLLNPDFTSVYFELGNLFYHSGRPGDAVRFYEETIQRNPLCAPAYGNIAVVRHAGGDARAAEWFYRKSIETDPEYYAAYRNYGRLCAEAGIDSGEARALFSRIATSRPGDPHVHYGMALFYTSAGERERARAELEACRAAAPDDLRMAEMIDAWDAQSTRTTALTVESTADGIRY